MIEQQDWIARLIKLTYLSITVGIDKCSYIDKYLAKSDFWAHLGLSLILITKYRSRKMAVE